MKIKSLELSGFRNYENQKVEFCPGVNVITGDNAQGKTNLLESIFYLTGAKSFRSRYDREVIAFDRDEAKISAVVESDEREQKIDICLKKGRKKQISVNNNRLKTGMELAGRFTCVLFSPDDLYLIKEGACIRRRLMDTCISQLKPRYGRLISEYAKVYAHKSQILKCYHDKPSLFDTLDIFNQRLALLSAHIISYRVRFVKALEEHAKKIHRDFSGGEELTLRYKTVSTVSDPFESVENIYEQILRHQECHKRAELESGNCLTGIHKDDIEIFINGLEARKFASQGQCRTAALSIKLAERELHRESKGEYPVLLLDDVLSELDPNRRSFILNRIENGQIFITCCGEEQSLLKASGRVIKVRNGVLD
ncbi:MAG: DNA replication/repair protein RecF [Ruminococcaceae bacterium]|nr:DNA replication/repair protein RecF [Oscillospiraceae bacterium]